jgi:hypothetical protein
LHPSIKHITMAVAELHASLEELSDQTGLSRLRFMQNYSTAVALITKGPTRQATEVVLICCLLFAACEKFQGDPMAGLLHIEGGTKLLREWKTSEPQQLNRNDPQARRSDLIERQIAPIFELAEYQIATSRNISLGQQEGSPPTTPGTGEGTPDPETPVKPLIPEGYETFCKARHQLNEAIQWTSRALHWDIAATTSIVVDPTTSMKEAKALLSQWLMAFDQYRPQPGGVHEKEFLRKECVLLRAHQRAASIMVEILPSTSEMVFDEHLDDFKTLLQESSAAAVPSTVASISFHFGFSLGLISPLFLIATRCRDPSLRREAVAVLRSTHQSEGCWDSCSAALIAEHVINIEERGLTVAQSATDITTFSRLRLVGAQVDYTSQQLVLRVARYPFNGLDPPIEEERIPWRTVVGQDRDMVEWVSQLCWIDFLSRDFAFSNSVYRSSPADSYLAQPLDKLLGAAGYQGLIRPERGICRHTAAMRTGADGASVTADVQMSLA